MSPWRSWHVHSSELDRLILDCLQPVLERQRQRLERCFWERHFAGGPHVRVRFRGHRAALDAASGDLVPAVERYLAEHPSPDLADYSEERAAALLEKEGIPAALQDLRYRNNVLLERPYRRRELFTGPPDALELAEDFRHETEPLAVAVLRGPLPKREQMLRLFFVKALFGPRGDIRQGSVSWKSHWEGFAAGLSSPELPQRIAEAYERDREGIHALMDEVLELHRRDALRHDAVLGPWQRILESFSRRTRRMLEEGREVLRQPATVEEAREVRERVLAGLKRESSFVSRFWADERFVVAIRREPRFQVPRMLTNLLYLLVPAVGLTPVDKMALCYYAHRPVEERFDCDLEALLASNISGVIARHARPGAEPVTDRELGGTRAKRGTADRKEEGGAI